MSSQERQSIALGPVVLFGSGETSPSGRKIFEQVFRKLPASPQVVLLETPAGFELNSDMVIGRVADFLRRRLQNFQPQVKIVPARQRGTPYSPDNEQIVAPLYDADLIFMGPGSPSYAVRQLRGSLAWQIIVARHRLGAALALASAATIAIGVYALPVYEIYKAGEELHWKAGLDFFGDYQLPLVFVPHWNNTDGGDELDTSRCFMGQERFSILMDMLPGDLTVLGIDEKTGLYMDPQAGSCHVTGLGGVTLLHTGHAHNAPLPDLSATGLDEIARDRHAHVHRYMSGKTFPLSDCCPFELPRADFGLEAEIWQKALAADERKRSATRARQPVPAQVQELLAERDQARKRKDWDAADHLRDTLLELGWQVMDTPEGPRLEKA